MSSMYQEIYTPFIVKVHGKRDKDGKTIYHYKKMHVCDDVIYLTNVCKTITVVRKLFYKQRLEYEKFPIDYNIQMCREKFKPTGEEVYIITCLGCQIYISDYVNNQKLALVYSYVTYDRNQNKSAQTTYKIQKQVEVSYLPGAEQKRKAPIKITKKYDEELSGSTDKKLDECIRNDRTTPKLTQNHNAFNKEDMFSGGYINMIVQSRKKQYVINDFKAENDVDDELNKVFAGNFV